MKDKFYPYGHQSINDDDIKEIVDVLKSDWVTQGPKVQEFEKAVANYCDVKHAVAVSNGTAALHLACLSINLNEKDEGITSTNSFAASANCIAYCGARPVLADIKRKTFDIDPVQIKKKITEKTKVLIPVDFAGQPYDYEIIYEIASDNNIKIISDAAHSIGAEFKVNKKTYKTGSCQFSDLSIFSFHPVKNITTGEGGIITTNNDEFYEKLLMLRTHGITKDPRFLKNNHGPWYYEMQMLGYNYRITDFQCALGLSQLKKLDRFIKRRREIAQLYNEYFENVEEINTPVEKENVVHVYHLYIIQINKKLVKKSKKRIFEDLRKLNIGVQLHYIPIHYHPFYKENYGYKEGDFPVAEDYYQNAISIPIYWGLTNEDIGEIVSRIKTNLKN